MVYGSQARGNPRNDSDIDILQLVDKAPRAYSAGIVNVAQYRPSTIKAMAQGGSLFVHHLMTEGVMLSDPSKALTRCFDEYTAPSDDYSQMLDDISQAGQALDDDLHSGSNLVGLCRLGVYLLRTTLYIQAKQRAMDTFDLPTIINAIGDQFLQATMETRRLPDARLTQEHLAALRYQLSGRLMTPLNNPYGSLEALAIMSVDNTRVSPLLGSILMGNKTVNYSALSFPPF